MGGTQPERPETKPPQEIIPDILIKITDYKPVGITYKLINEELIKKDEGGGKVFEALGTVLKRHKKPKYIVK